MHALVGLHVNRGPEMERDTRAQVQAGGRRQGASRSSRSMDSAAIQTTVTAMARRLLFAGMNRGKHDGSLVFGKHPYLAANYFNHKPILVYGQSACQ